MQQQAPEPRRERERIPYPEPASQSSLPGPPHGDHRQREAPSPARREAPSLRDAPPLGRNQSSGREPSARDFSSRDSNRDPSRGRDRDQSAGRRDPSAGRQRSPAPGRDPSQWPATSSGAAGSQHHGSQPLRSAEVHMTGSRTQESRQDSRQMPPPGPRQEAGYGGERSQEIPYGQQRGGDFQRGGDMQRGGEMQRGRGRSGRMGPPGRGGGRRLMDEGPIFDHQGRQSRDETPLRGREPEFLEPMLQDDMGMGYGPIDGMNGGPGRGYSMRGGMRGQGRMGYVNRGGPQGRALGRGGRGRGLMMGSMEGPPGGPLFRPGMGPRGGPMDQAGPGGRFGGRGLGPAWGPRGSFPSDNGPPGVMQRLILISRLQ